MTFLNAIFPWNEHFDTGISVIDEQHRKLVDLLNNLASSLAYGLDMPNLIRVLNDLADYTDYHFRTEEAIWRKYLPQDDMSIEHIKTHQDFAYEIHKLKGNLPNLGDKLVVDEIVSFLTHWLALHILDTDKHMAKIVHFLQQGMPLQSAKENARNEMSGAMRVLIETVLKMYDDLSSRTLELMREIAERQRAEENLRLSQKVIDSTLEAIFITDPECRIIDTNPSFCQDVNRQHDELLGMSIRDVKPNLFNLDKKDEILKAASENGHWSGEIVGRNANNEIEAVWLTVSAIRDNNGIITNFVGVLSSVTQLLERQQNLADAANHDALTGLPNRRLLQDRLKLAIARSNRNNHQLAVCFIDLDGFKQVNDSLGHEAGDEVLRIVSARLCKVLRSDDTVARFGGDEFVLLLGDIENENALDQLLNRLLQDIKQPILIHSQAISISASIGVALHPQDKIPPDQLLLHADEAMYSAKKKGKSQYQHHR